MAADPLSVDAMMLTETLAPSEIARFRVEGFVHQPAVFDATDVLTLNAELARLVDAGGAVAWTGPWDLAETGHGFAPVRYLHLRSQPWRSACVDRLGPVAKALLGESASVAEAMGIIKPPQIGQSFPWHQDGAYYGPLDGRYVIANVYLDDMTPTNGSLRVLPCTHDRFRAHADRDGKKVVELGDLDPIWPIVEPHAKAGDVVWFHLWTIHGSAPNHSDRVRRAVRVGFLGGTP